MPGSDVVWSIDYHSGIDILRFDERAKAPTTAQIDASWLSKLGVVDNWAQIQRMVRLGVEPVPQPVFMYDFGDLYAAVLGHERADPSYP